MIKILAIGDPHGSDKIKDIPFEDIDLILVPGDLPKADIARKLFSERVEGKTNDPKLAKKAFIEIYDSTLKVLKFLSKKAPVYFIYGDFEYSDERVKRRSKQIGYKLPFIFKAMKSIKNIKVIQDKVVNFKGIRIGGLERFEDVNWVRDFKPIDYDKRMKRAKKETDRAKKILKKFGYVDILLCHQPPYGILDKVRNPNAPKNWQGKHAGSKAIFSYIKTKSPKFVFCGHIHESKGKKKIGKTAVYNLGFGGDYKIIDIN